MKYKKVVAIVRRSRLDEIERELLRCGVQGLTVTPVKGYGEYADTFARDLMVPHVRVEIFRLAEEVETIVRVLLEKARTGVSGDGLVAVEPVERIVRIRTGSAPPPGEL